MKPRSRLAVSLLTLIGTSGLLLGCVERRFVITTEPTGAIVFDEKGLRTGGDGKAPVDRTFIYYGDYQFTLVADGYETQIVREKVRPPFYEWFLLDFFSENVVPWTLRDIRRFHYQLQPRQVIPPDAVLSKASALRERGLGIGIPLPNLPNAPGPVTSALMPPVP